VVTVGIESAATGDDNCKQTAAHHTKNSRVARQLTAMGKPLLIDFADFIMLFFTSQS
jgi:hypothetical protein